MLWTAQIYLPIFSLQSTLTLSFSDYHTNQIVGYNDFITALIAFCHNPLIFLVCLQLPLFLYSRTISVFLFSSFIRNPLPCFKWQSFLYQDIFFSIMSIILISITILVTLQHLRQKLFSTTFIRFVSSCWYTFQDTFLYTTALFHYHRKLVM